MIREELMGKDQRDVHGSPSAGLTRQTAGTSTDRRGVPTLHLTGLGAQNPCTAIHDHFFAMPLLIIEAKHKLPMVLGTAGDAIRADRARAESRGGMGHRREAETDQDSDCQQETAHVLPVGAPTLLVLQGCCDGQDACTGSGSLSSVG